MIDHATGVVIGETCEIESEVSIFQGVTLGGKGFESGKRHPNIKKGASIFAASTILGDITIGEGAIVAAATIAPSPIVMSPRIVLAAKIDAPFLIFGCLFPDSKPLPPKVTP